jgi:hypothetical protein
MINRRSALKTVSHTGLLLASALAGRSCFASSSATSLNRHNSADNQAASSTLKSALQQQVRLLTAAKRELDRTFRLTDDSTASADLDECRSLCLASLQQISAQQNLCTAILQSCADCCVRIHSATSGILQTRISNQLVTQLHTSSQHCATTCHNTILSAQSQQHKA